MKKRVDMSSRITSSFESSLNKISKIYKASEKKQVRNNSEKNLVISPTVAKLTFIVLMVLIFLSLTFNSSGYLNEVTSYSILEQTNPAANLAIFFGLLVLVFFLSYERKRLK